METQKTTHFKLTESLAALGDYKNGYRMELNKVSWYDRNPKYDIRPWNEDHTDCRKGIVLSEEQFGFLEDYCKAL